MSFHIELDISENCLNVLRKFVISKIKDSDTYIQLLEMHRTAIPPLTHLTEEAANNAKHLEHVINHNLSEVRKDRKQWNDIYTALIEAKVFGDI